MEIVDRALGRAGMGSGVLRLLCSWPSSTTSVPGRSYAQTRVKAATPGSTMVRGCAGWARSSVQTVAGLRYPASRTTLGVPEPRHSIERSRSAPTSTRPAKSPLEFTGLGAVAGVASRAPTCCTKSPARLAVMLPCSTKRREMVVGTNGCIVFSFMRGPFCRRMSETTTTTIAHLAAGAWAAYSMRGRLEHRSGHVRCRSQHLCDAVEEQEELLLVQGGSPGDISLGPFCDAWIPQWISPVRVLSRFQFIVYLSIANRACASVLSESLARSRSGDRGDTSPLRRFCGGSRAACVDVWPDPGRGNVVLRGERGLVTSGSFSPRI